ncbi:AsnC family transcriptional regulator [Kocuria sp. CCUG 69068]|uniref:Lrp/AsnC family transcriptional regulator n=1 Tax=Kocuria sp. CCUG 69068 TaxID=2043138 RepID=UPI001E321C2C|nr:AsnC family transcriptional regulator [Kocuria sp. CCUG 69068]
MDDPMDVRLATEVSHDPRATLAQLSERVGLSVSAVQARLRKLESNGVIAGYQAILDPEAIGKPLAAFIEITPLDPRQPDNAPELLQSITAIEACHSVAGDSAYMLFVRVASPKALEALVNEVRHVASVNTRTTVVLQTFYEHRPMLSPVEA